MRYVRVLLLMLAALPAFAEDWPMFRHDREFTASTGDTVKPPLDRVWLFRSRQSRHAPELKGDPATEFTPEHNRHALCITAAGDALFFTSRADGRVVCLDAATAKIRWQFVAGSAVNRPATLFEGRVYAGSDDGHVYCLDAQTGKPAWIFKAVPLDRWLFSYNRLASAWPVRTNILIDKGVAYVGAGIFPHDGTSVIALDARTGAVVWRNDTHAETEYRWALSPNGNLYATEQDLYVPNDVKPFRWAEFNAFRRADGSHDEWGSSDPKCPVPGQDLVTLAGAVRGNRRYVGNAAQTITWSKQEHGKNVAAFAGVWSAETPGYALDIASVAGHAPMRGAPLMYNPDLCPVIVTEGVVYSLRYRRREGQGADGKVFAHDAQDGKELWSAEIGEWPDQVIAAGGRLFVSTRSGTIYAYAPKGTARHGASEESVEAAPQGPVDALVKQAGVTEGYALVLDCTSGGLAAALAKETDLDVVAVFDDAARAAAAREAYGRAGLHVRRILVWHRAPGKVLPFPPYFADLVVSEAPGGGAADAHAEDVERLLKPIRGVSLLGGRRTVRPRLEGAGGWTHALGDAGHSMCSNDGVLKPPLGVVWTGRPFSARGSRGISPAILADGVLVHQTTTMFDARGYTEGYDAYTGRPLWRHVSGVTDTVGARGAIFQRYLESITQFDPWTGKVVKQYLPPHAPGKWTGMSASRDGRTLFLHADGEDAQEKTWSCALALDVASGHVLWKLGGPEQERQWGMWSAVSDGRLYYVGGEPTPAERAEAAADMQAWLKTLPGDEYKELAAAMDKHSFTTLTAVDAKTGKQLYRKAVDNTNAGGGWTRQVVSGGRRQYQPHLLGAVIANGGTVVFATSAGADKSWAVWPGGGYKGRALSVYDGATGKLLWYRFANYRARPVVTEDLVIAEPWAFHVRSGKPKTRTHPITGREAVWAFCRHNKQCGTFNASRHFVFGRSRGIGYHDLVTDQGLYTFLHSRSSCWIDTSSGGGVMIKPPHAISCRCEVSMPFTVAMAQVRTPLAHPQMFSQPGPYLPVKHLYLDFGATGDRRDAQGRLWVAARKPWSHPLLMTYGVETEVAEGGGDVRRSAVYTRIENADVPFVFATAVRGLRKCVVPLAESGSADYTVRLGFSALPGDQPGQRVFDVLLNGEPVLQDFDIVRAAGKPDRALWKEFSLSAEKALTLELVPKSGLPLLNALQVLR